MPDRFTITFWGVRGTVPTPGKRTLRYGGNTSCVQFSCGARELIFDAGTGIYPLGEQLTGKEADLFLSHTHIDHIVGFPFFSGAYDPECTLRVWAGHLAPEERIRDVLARLMHPPIFPLTLDFLSSRLSFHDFTAGNDLDAPHLAASGIRIRTHLLNHPDRATAYRVEYAGKSACYVTDVEHVPGQVDAELVAFLRGADVVIYDSTFDDAHFARFKGWGHSTWQQALRLGDAAQAGKVVLFHHDPGMDDDALDARQATLTKLRPGSLVAAEGMRIQL
jgi:phosphoribosyl 1,2-cyclic phosphodiesterase